VEAHFKGMAKTTICFGVVLILLGLFGFVATGSHYPTALIPAVFGLILGILGFLAITDDAKKRMLYMHIAVTIGLLGFLGTAKSIYDYVLLMQGRQFPHPAAVEAKAAMAGILLVFVVLCVRSFIAARRARA
jgi:multisubunit Na+/H+ antiporter MnhF subunit